MIGEIDTNQPTGIKLAELDGDTFVLDVMGATSNASRLINHSCNANLVMVPVFIEHHDHRCPNMALFARRTIEPDEELTLDFGDEYWLATQNQLCQCNRSVDAVLTVFNFVLLARTVVMEAKRARWLWRKLNESSNQIL